MSDLQIDKESVFDLFSNKEHEFLIPDYQRPYAWTGTECSTLWDDLVAFALPNNKVNPNFKDTYFLGSIVTFTNSDSKLEVIDGQQRLTTLMLLLRAFYTKFENATEDNPAEIRRNLERCIWKTDMFGKPSKDDLKINSEVALDDDKDEFISILKTGECTDKQKSKYAENFRLFKDKIQSFNDKYPYEMEYLAQIIMMDCVLLPINAPSQDAAFRIFTTLNDRGKPLSDSDIFKSQLYKHYISESVAKKDEFIGEWNELRDRCMDIFETPDEGDALDEIFTRYMYYERAKQRINDTTTESLRKFFEKNDYALFKKDETFENIIQLSKFWESIDKQDTNVFSDGVLRDLFVLNFAPNGMWKFFLSVYFMANKDSKNRLDDEKLQSFLKKTIAFVWAYAYTNPGVNALRTPMFSEMINIIDGKEASFSKFKFDSNLRNLISNYEFTNNKPMTKSMLAWWMFQNENQDYLPLDTKYEIEHIYAKKRYEFKKGLEDASNLESIGNKALLEKSVNIRAADYNFEDKKRYYRGENNKKMGTKNQELLNLAKDKTDFEEQDIVNRKNDIVNGFMKFMGEEGLLQEPKQ